MWLECTLLSHQESLCLCGETAECLPGRKWRVVLEVKAALLLLRYERRGGTGDLVDRVGWEWP